MNQNIHWRLVCLLVFLGPAVFGCGGFLDQDADGKLGVPFSYQKEYNYCVPASIVMWREYDGLSSVSQDEIWSTLGEPPCSGSDAAFGVRLFTQSGADAFLHTTAPTDRNEYISRQITSIDSGVPVMAVFGPARNHVGIVNGGQYGQRASTGEYIWNFVYFHDPAVGPNRYFISDDWINEVCGSSFSVCGQVVSGAASYAWTSNLQTWGDSVITYNEAGCCNEEFKN